MFLGGLRRWQGWGLVLLRVVVGVIFAMHGWQKLVSYGVSGTAAFMNQLGLPAPWLAALVLILVELIGGLALLVGLFSRIAAVLLAIDMLVALLLVTLPKGFFLPEGGEFTLLLFAASVALMLSGPGNAALEDVLCKRRGETNYGSNREYERQE